jgi:hypothetical protein
MLNEIEIFEYVNLALPSKARLLLVDLLWL